MRKTIGPFTSTNSDVLNSNNLENVSFVISATGISSGNCVLTVLGSNDGVNFTAISFVDPTATNTNAQTLTRIASLTVNANNQSGQKIGVLENTFKFEFIKFTLTISTDGSYTVLIHADEKATT